MKIKVKEGHAGVMTLKDGTQMNYSVIRITRNLSKVIFYTDEGLRIIFNTNMTEEERKNVIELKKLNEKTLMKLGYISEMPLTNIKDMN